MPDSASARIREALRVRSDAVDGLRAIGVLLLVLGHYAATYHPGAILDDALVLASYSIVVLFVLAGFMVTSAALDEFERTGDIAIGRLIGRKALRLYPTLVAFTLVTTAHHLYNGEEVPLLRIAALLGLFVNYYNALALDDAVRHSVGHLWSVALGAHFVLVWLVVLRSGLRRGALGQLAGFLVVIAVLSALLRVVLYPRFTDLSAAYLYNATETRMDQMAIGALGALALRLPAASRVLDRVLAVPWLLAMGVVGLLASVTRPLDFANGLGHTLNAALTLLVLLLLVSSRGGSGARASALLRLTWISAISYSLFTWHWYGLALRPLFAGLPPILDMVLTVGTTVACSGVAFLILEYPFRRRAHALR